MKNECNVARDLMPLCIDGVASEESQQYVDKHVASCHDCELVYGEMKSALPQVTAEKENAALAEAWAEKCTTYEAQKASAVSPY